MTLDRRRLLTVSGAAVLIGAGAAYGIRKLRRHRHDLTITGDDGNPVVNFRLPGDAAAWLAALPGLTTVGAPEAAITLYEFFDYNCPECRVAAGALAGLARSEPGLRIALVNNPVVSAPSAQAARIVLAVQRSRGSQAAFAVYERLFAGRGRVDAARALEAASASGLSRDELESLGGSEAVRADLRAQMQAATDLGLFATPAYVFGAFGIVGHPGPKALAGMVAAMRSCDQVACG